MSLSSLIILYKSSCIYSQEYGKDFGTKSFFEEFPGWRTEPVIENLLAYGEMLVGA